LSKPGFSGKINIVRIFSPNSKFKYSTLRDNNIKVSNFKKANLVSVATYPDVENLKDIIIKENSNKGGIYIWINLINGKSYVGSAWDLSNRFKQYFRKSFLEQEIKKNRSKIYRALLRYGYSAFKLEILEYCEKDIIITREQYYLDTISPEYNILKVARSLLGFKHSPESI
jgi:hypothetical protein